MVKLLKIATVRDTLPLTLLTLAGDTLVPLPWPLPEAALDVLFHGFLHEE